MNNDSINPENSTDSPDNSSIVEPSSQNASKRGRDTQTEIDEIFISHPGMPFCDTRKARSTVHQGCWSRGFES